MTQNDGTKSVELYFPDGSTVGSRLGPFTTARQLCLDVRSKLGLQNDADFGLFEETNSRYDRLAMIACMFQVPRPIYGTCVHVLSSAADTSIYPTIHSSNLLSKAGILTWWNEVSRVTLGPALLSLTSSHAFALPPSALAGRVRLVYRRRIFVPDSALEDEERTATAVTSAAHYLAFVDAVSKVCEVKILILSA